MARYRRIDPRMWGDERFQALSRAKPNAQTLWIYILTGPHTTSLPGLWHVGERALSESLQWPLRALRRCLDATLFQNLLRIDKLHNVLYVKNVLNYDPPASPNVVIYWGKLYDEIPECELKSCFHYDFQNYLYASTAEGYRKAFAKAFGKPSSKASAKTMAIPVPLPLPLPDPLPDPRLPEVDPSIPGPGPRQKNSNRQKSDNYKKRNPSGEPRGKPRGKNSMPRAGQDVTSINGLLAATQGPKTSGRAR